MAVVFTVTNRIPAAHDTLQELMLRYYFLNSAATTGEIPLWMPYMTQGTVANWWYFVQGGLLQNILLSTGEISRHVPFLLAYHGQNALEASILALGVWLLSGKFYLARFARMFALIAVVGTVTATYQIWFGIRWLYAIPILLFLLHEFLETGNWKLVAGTLLLFTTQWVGNLPYVLSAQFMVICIYGFGLALSEPAHFVTRLRALRRPTRHDLALLALAVSPLYFGYTILATGTDWIANYNPGRHFDGSTSFDTFWTYGGSVNAETLKSVLLAADSKLDIDVYLGWVIGFFAILGLLCSQHKHYRVLVFTSVCLSLFAIGQPTILMQLIYNLIPSMHYFRHAAHTIVFVKVFVCFIAALGVDELFSRGIHAPPISRFANIAVTSVVLLVFWLFMLGEPLTQAQLKILLGLVVAIAPFIILVPTLRNTLVFQAIYVFAIAAMAWSGWLLGALWLALGGLVLLLIIRIQHNPRYKTAIVILILSVLGGELGIHQLTNWSQQTRIANNVSKQLFSYSPMPYRPRRCDHLLHSKSQHERSHIFLTYLKPKIGALYWSTESFLFEDCLDSPFRVDHFLLPYDWLMKFFWGQNFIDPNVIPAGRYYNQFQEISYAFPRTNASLKLAGVNEDKVQFFDGAAIVDSPQAVGQIMRDANFSGDSLAVIPPTSLNASIHLPDRTIPISSTKTGNTRKTIPYAVTTFSSNRIQLLVTAPMQPTPLWLLYADVWHPSWRATINGTSSVVYPANLAYKAIPLVPGRNLIDFQFVSPLVKLAYYAFSFFSLSCLAWLGWLAKHYFSRT